MHFTLRTLRNITQQGSKFPVGSSANSKEIMSLLWDFNKEFNQTVIMITHDEKIARTADRVISMVDGHIVGNEVMGE